MVCSLLAALALQPGVTNLRRIYEEALERREREYGAADARTGRAARDLGLFLLSAGDAEGARRALAKGLDIDQKVFGMTSRQARVDAADLAGVSSPAAAEPLWRYASESDDVGLASRALASLAELREAAGDRAAAVELYRKALAAEERVEGKDAPRVAVRLNALALVAEPREGILLLERALAIDRRAWGERHPETATAEANLSGLLLASGRAAEAVRAGRLALAGFEATLGGEHPRTAAAASNLADALRTLGDRTGAERLYRRALAIDERAYGPNHPETLTDVRNLAEFLREIGRAREAEQLEVRLSGVQR